MEFVKVLSPYWICFVSTGLIGWWLWQSWRMESDDEAIEPDVLEASDAIEMTAEPLAHTDAPAALIEAAEPEHLTARAS